MDGIRSDACALKAMHCDEDEMQATLSQLAWQSQQPVTRTSPHNRDRSMIEGRFMRSIKTGRIRLRWSGKWRGRGREARREPGVEQRDLTVGISHYFASSRESTLHSPSSHEIWVPAIVQFMMASPMISRGMLPVTQPKASKVET